MNTKVLLAIFVMVSFIVARPVVCWCTGKQLKAFEVERSSGSWYGYKDVAGRVVVDPKFTYAYDFTSCGIGAVFIPKEGWWFIDADGNKVLTPKPMNIDVLAIDDFGEGLIRYKEDNKIGFMNECGKSVIPAEYDSAAAFDGGYAVVGKGCHNVREGEYSRCEGGLWGMINKRGAAVVPVTYDEYTFRNGKVVFRKGQTWFSSETLMATKG